MKALRLLPRVIMVMMIIVTLLGGLGAALARLGLPMDSMSQSWIMIHGPLMISGFLGTLICLERAVALASRYRWSIIVPVVNALGAISLLLMRDSFTAKLLLTAGSAGLLILFGVMLRLHPSRDIAIMAFGALCWLIGNAVWLAGQPIYQVVHLWSAFLILTIVGERLELSRVRRLTRISVNWLIIAVGVYALGNLITLIDLGFGVRMLGFGAVLMAVWLLRYDIARRTIKQSGLARYIAACLLIGYGWLAFGGVLAIGYGAIYAGPAYAAVLHALLLGFVFSMIFGHAPIILPALTGLRLKYTPIFYGHLFLLHGTLIYRIYGELSGDFAARQQAGLWNVITVLVFMGVTALTVIRSNLGQGTNESIRPVIHEASTR